REGRGQVDLVDALEHKGTDVQVGVMWDHGQLRRMGSAIDKAKLAGHVLAEMPKSPRFSPSPVRIIEVLAYPAVQLLDVTGPIQVFASANDIVADTGGARPYDLRVVAQAGEGVTASAGVTLAAGPLTQPAAALDTLVV